jgi:type VI secretion system secreted protein VgrG
VLPRPGRQRRPSRQRAAADHYHLELVPRLASLAHCRNLRIFQQQNVPQIIATVLKAHGILADAYVFRLGPTPYEKREYCTQYDETDLAFVQRLCEEEGLHYHFEHSADAHLLVFGDEQSAFPRLARPTLRAAQWPGRAAAGDQPVRCAGSGAHRAGQPARL